MKKTLVLLFAVLLVVAFTLPASAFDSVFGGYWRTRFYIQSNFTGNKDVDGVSDGKPVTAINPDYDPALPDTFPGGTNPSVTQKEGVDTVKSANVIDTRTRLYYTAVFSDDFQFVNRFEFNVTWGASPGGQVGTDGTGIFRIKHSYADFRTGAFRWTVGLQGQVLARGFLFDDDFAGVVARYQPGTTADMLIPVMYARIDEGAVSSVDINDPPSGTGASDNVNLWAVYPFFPVGNMNFNPYFVYLQPNLGQDNDQWWLGLDWDMKFDPVSLWLTGIYQGGDVDSNTDISAYLLGLGVNVPLGGFGVHGEAFYATGDDDATDDSNKAFTGAPGQSYYWSEIMGYGIIDNQASFGSPANKISNMYAVNVGLDFKPSDMWALKADLWYASLIEELAVDAGKDLGTEIDIVGTYTVTENMKLDLIGAYLFAGKATNAGEATNTGKSADPYELAMRLSFSF